MNIINLNISSKKFSEDLASLVSVLINNEYDITIQKRDNVAFIEFDYSNSDLAENHIEWLNDEEIEAIQDYRKYRVETGGNNIKISDLYLPSEKDFPLFTQN